MDVHTSEPHRTEYPHPLGKAVDCDVPKCVNVLPRLCKVCTRYTTIHQCIGCGYAVCPRCAPPSTHQCACGATELCETCATKTARGDTCAVCTVDTCLQCTKTCVYCKDRVCDDCVILDSRCMTCTDCSICNTYLDADSEIQCVACDHMACAYCITACRRCQAPLCIDCIDRGGEGMGTYCGSCIVEKMGI